MVLQLYSNHLEFRCGEFRGVVPMGNPDTKKNCKKNRQWRLLQGLLNPSLIYCDRSILFSVFNMSSASRMRKSEEFENALALISETCQDWISKGYREFSARFYEILHNISEDQIDFSVTLFSKIKELAKLKEREALLFLEIIEKSHHLCLEDLQVILGALPVRPVEATWDIWISYVQLAEYLSDFFPGTTTVKVRRDIDDLNDIFLRYLDCWRMQPDFPKNFPKCVLLTKTQIANLVPSSETVAKVYLAGLSDTRSTLVQIGIPTS
ncbi:MAG: hypothetical protein AB8G05_04145 [Oligoflexales bacterium]